jgi:subtilisin family serine protease
MNSKKILFSLLTPFAFSSAFATTQVIPKAVEDLKLMDSQSVPYVLKHLEGRKSFFNVNPENWFNLSPLEGIEGVRTEDVYKDLGLPLSDDVIVAVIDSGVDVNHEDLQGKIWINRGEVANDGIDNDSNGYVDDVFGWNFIGGQDGMATIVEDQTLANGLRLLKGKPDAQVGADTLEVTRELVRMKKLKKSVEELGEELSESQITYLNKVQEIVSSNVQNAKQVIEVNQNRLAIYKENEKVLNEAGLFVMTLEALRAFTSNDETVLKAKDTLIQMISRNQTEKRLNRVLEYYGDQLTYFYNEDFNSRSIVGDVYSDLSDRFYGNNDVIGPDAGHGTHVAGSIAAVRNNGVGINGVATNVKIMAVRVIPNGDERDKDVANGIRYAVDNGAKIINMSFGKAFSPYKRYVDEAVRYAESKGVLMVHAAGNDNKDNDLLPSFPSRFDKAEKREFNNWLEIGASSSKRGLNLPADFSNFGKKTVDFFAPGVDIYSTTPDNTYDTYSGTSMATPTTAGVAALVLSYDPILTAEDLRSLLIDTSRRYPKLLVYRPGSQEEILFSGLSTYGSVVDAYKALTLTK